MLRAPQVVIVGDDKQLPPTSFFDQVLIDDEATDSDEGAFESILDRCAGLLPSYVLRWHYRSKDEALITFSNGAYYHGNLITFPSAERHKERGVHFHFVPDGVYDRGGTRTNVREAETVAHLVLAHYAAGRSESLGVIALSQAQQDAIREALDTALSRRPDVLVPEDGLDGLFIKNLENVQGDERDAIILSIGYARDAGGTLSHNFGPLNKKGGERRLNVAITRARQSLTVVSSIRATDIDLTRTNATALAQLRDYLAYAEAGGGQAFPSTATGVSTDSLIESDIRRRLEERGYRVETSIGHSDQRIGLAIVDPTQPNRYLLGIESDGPVYHAAPTARDRDRLRGAVLEGLGWRMHRIWARDWVRDPDTELRRLYDCLQRQVHLLSPVTLPAKANAPICARCGGALSTTAHFCGHCGVPAGVPIPPTQRLGTLSPSSAVASAGASSCGMTTGPLAVGTVLNGRYRIMQLLGVGAFGRVYRAEDLLDSLCPPLAIKELMDDQFTTAADKQEAVRWFRREVSTLLNLDHPSMPTVHAYWTASVNSGPFYLAMDFIDGKTLEQTLDEKGQIDWQQAGEWGMQLCKALAYLHGQTPPFLFRDLKPANIMIEAGTNMSKLIDFGIARQFTAHGGQTAIGTPGYVPIEQFMGRTEPRSDLYAVGAVLHSVVSGKKPHAELSRLQAAGLDLTQAMKQLFPPLNALVPGVPPLFAQVIARAHAYETVDRYPDAVTLGIALMEKH